MQIVEKALGEIRPYNNNPRNNTKAVDKVAESIRAFGFKVPIVIDKDGEIVAGHTRYLAAIRLGLSSVPCITADDLNDEEVRAFRLADNKVAEFASWDPSALLNEMRAVKEINMTAFGFDRELLKRGVDWFAEHEDGSERQEGNDEYNAFLDKFEAKHTTDDCYTPPRIYDVVESWVRKEYGLKDAEFVRPFFPGGDYQSDEYPDGCVVVDNPPFSILSEIVEWYNEHGIRYFLFAPAVTNLKNNACAVCAGASITYENGARVNTGFLTNLEDAAARSAPELRRAIKAADEENRAEARAELKKHLYPPEVVTASMLNYLSVHGVDLKIEKKDASKKIGALDEQKKSGDGIYGGAFLLSEKAAAEKAAAEKAAAEKAAAEKAAAEKAAALTWALSEREREIVKGLG